MSLGTDNFNGLRHQMHSSKRMMEAGMMRSGIYQVRHAKLTDSAQALEVRMLDDGLNQLTLYSNETINRIVKKKCFGHKMVLK